MPVKTKSAKKIWSAKTLVRRNISQLALKLTLISDLFFTDNLYRHFIENNVPQGLKQRRRIELYQFQQLSSPSDIPPDADFLENNFCWT